MLDAECSVRYATSMAHPTDSIIALMRSPSAEDKEVIKRAYDFAERAHGDEKRKSGEPYIVHPHAIATYLASIGMDRDTIVAGILHDTTEDTHVSPEDIEKEFGGTIRFLVDSLTKLSRLRYAGLERHVESLRHLLVATASDIRVIIIKMADRLHNMRTIQYVSPIEKRERIARDTMEVYVPIAERLGMGNIKAELEDLSFSVLDPERYKDLKITIQEATESAEDKLEEDIRDLKRHLAENGIRHFRTEFRVKGVHSFSQKAKKYDNDIAQVYDLFALRVIVKNTEECYRILGIVHGLWRPIPGKVKDYIAFPKPNGYRSLHTTVITHRGVTVEMQIRTEEMHQDAQFGVASHFGYKGLIRSKQTGSWIYSLIPSLRRYTPESSTQSPRWLQELSEAEREHPDYENFEEILKKDFFAERIFAFTPKGDVIDLPRDATPVDFAYNIHSDVGDTMSGAKINGKLASLDTVLKNGDVVEIVTNKNTKPNKKWLDIAKTVSAKAHIRAALRKNHEPGF